jgi:hypothetical protein
MNGVHAASTVLPRIVAAAYRYQNFPTTRGWAEMMRQDGLPKFSDLQGSDVEQFLSPKEEAARLLGGAETSKRRPQETSAWFARTADEIEREASAATAAAGANPGAEFITSVTDLRILAGLARYYSKRLLAAVSYNVFTRTGDLGAFDEAISLEAQAIEAWRGIVAAAGDVYSHDLAFGVHNVGFPRHWSEELANLERDFATLKAQRAAARPGSTTVSIPAPRTAGDTAPPTVKILPPGPATEGRDLRVSVQASDPSGVKTVRLRYRHLTQFEDYESVTMTLDAKTAQYSAAIPASFITRAWDVMFFVEAIDTRGNGRNYPDLEVETPYVVVPVRR